MATLKDIAKRCNVSVSTVSLVLNDKKECYASQAVKDRIIETARKLRYQHNAHYRSAIRGEKTQIGCIITSTKRHCWHFLEVLSRCSKGENLSCSVIVDATDPLENQIASLLSQNVRGIMICASCGPIDPEYLEYLEEQRCAIVTLGKIQNCRFPSIAPDRDRAVFDMMKHLNEKGHQRILSLLCKGSEPYCRSLYAGFVNAADALNMCVDQIEGDGEDLYLSESSADAFEQWWDGTGSKTDNGEPAASAIVCVDDLCAAAVIKRIRQQGLSVPNDLAVVSCRCEEVGNYFNPPITSIEIPYAEMAQRASQFLFDIFEHGIESFLDREILVPCKLRLRESSNTPEQPQLT